MRTWSIFITVLPLLLAGCTSGGGKEAAGLEDHTEHDMTAGGAIRTVCVTDAVTEVEAGPGGVCPDVAVMVPVEFMGNLGTYERVCADPVPCAEYVAVTGETDFLHEHPGSVLTAVQLTLTWEAATPATDTLGIGAMRMGTNRTVIGNGEGTSPQVIEEDGLDLLLDDENLLHAYVYNVRGFVHNPPIYGYATVDQAFTVEGVLTFLVSPTCSPDAAGAGDGEGPPVVRCIVPA